MFRSLFRCLLLSLCLLGACIASSRADDSLPNLPDPNLPAPMPAVTDEQSTRVVAPGVELTTIRRNNAGAPLQLFLVKVDSRAGGKESKWKLKLAPAEYSVLKAATVSAMAKRENAVVAINGGYFAFGGAALGAVKVDGEWIRLPWKNRTALGVLGQGGVLFDNLHADAVVAFRDEANREIASLQLNNFNGYAPTDGLSLMTQRITGAYKLRADEVAIEVQNGVVRSRVESGAVNVRPDGWTLIAHGAARELVAGVLAGQKANLQINAPTVWEQYSTILGAGPRLLKNGEIFTTEKEEEFRPDVIARGPRSAFGVDKDGNWIFLVADGRVPEYSVGLTIPELAREMQLAGAVEAICLDGGGSTTLAVNGEVINRPSDGFERKVANALMVVGTASDGATQVAAQQITAR